MSAIGCNGWTHMARAVVLAGALAMGGIGASAERAMAEGDKRTLTVTASGKVEAKPDIALVQAGVETYAQTARAALDGNSAAMARIIAALKAKGFGERDLGTSAFSISPRYDNSKSLNQRNKIVGYSVSNTVSVKVRDIATVGAVLDELVDLGVNDVGGVSFIVSAADELLDGARSEAVKTARKRAELYAEAAGVKLGKVLRISEGRENGPEPRLYARAAIAESAVPIEPGMQELTQSVTVTFELD